MKRARDPWAGIGAGVWSLGFEAAAVVGLRTMKLAAVGPAAAAEAQRMVSEKIDAALALQALAMTGGLGVTPHSMAARSLNHYRRKVRANRRRLSK
ncbi:MAG TPA: hypothetical protein VFE13_15095 [Caulobacteraceae bacterium]|jgi:hypothetical protein|nr:hypothetical protein [Caulobacteraceae bacterium]